jgi:hypothetical protein
VCDERATGAEAYQFVYVRVVCYPMHLSGAVATWSTAGYLKKVWPSWFVRSGSGTVGVVDVLVVAATTVACDELVRMS